MITKQFFKYGLVGGLSAAVDFGCLFVFYTLLSMNSILSVKLAFIISAVFNYIAHYLFTFKLEYHNKLFLWRSAKYLIAFVISYFITVGLVKLFLFFGMNLYVAKVVCFIIVYIYGFFIAKYFIYRQPK